MKKGSEMEKISLGTKVCLYDPNPKRNGTITGTVIGGGFISTGPCYIVELDPEYQGFIHEGTTKMQYISTIVVDGSGAFKV